MDSNASENTMAPNLLGNSLFLGEPTSAEPVQIISTGKQVEQLPKYTKSAVKPATPKSTPQYKLDIVWRNVIIFAYLHGAAIYGLVLMFTGAAYLKSILWALVITMLCGQSITAGAHRLWAHRTYKARLPLRIFLAFFQTMSLQNHIYEWVRDHRVHHKFTDTDADPHNAKRGFFFSHIGWLLVKKHKDVITKGKTIDLSDLEADPVVRWQRKFYVLIAPLLCIGFPTFVPWYFWDEDLVVSFYVCGITRYVLMLNGTWLVNSAAHIWGTKPYDKSIGPTENVTVSFLAYGEGWHNYHHVFPWDYKAAELGNYRLNISTGFIDLMAKIGLAYDLKTVSVDMIKKRVKRTGDGTRVFDDEPNIPDDDHDHHHGHEIWGWGDKDMKDEDKSFVEWHHKKDE